MTLALFCEEKTQPGTVFEEPLPGHEHDKGLKALFLDPYFLLFMHSQPELG